MLLGQIHAHGVLVGGRAALLVHGPSVGLIATSDDAVVASDIMLLGICGNDRQTIDISLVSHDLILPQSTFDRRP